MTLHHVQEPMKVKPIANSMHTGGLSDLESSKVNEKSKLPSSQAGAGRSSQQKQKNEGMWSSEEHQLFIQSLKEFPATSKSRWKLVALRIKTRTSTQVRTHAQKYFKRIHSHESRAMNQLFTLWNQSSNSNQPQNTLDDLLFGNEAVLCPSQPPSFKPPARSQSLIEGSPRPPKRLRRTQTMPDNFLFQSLDIGNTINQALIPLSEQVPGEGHNLPEQTNNCSNKKESHANDVDWLATMLTNIEPTSSWLLDDMPIELELP